MGKSRSASPRARARRRRRRANAGVRAESGLDRGHEPALAEAPVCGPCHASATMATPTRIAPPRSARARRRGIAVREARAEREHERDRQHEPLHVLRLVPGVEERAGGESEPDRHEQLRSAARCREAGTREPASRRATRGRSAEARARHLLAPVIASETEKRRPASLPHSNDLGPVQEPSSPNRKSHSINGVSPWIFQSTK